jgi:hypothetical protein
MAQLVPFWVTSQKAIERTVREEKLAEKKA